MLFKLCMLFRPFTLFKLIMLGGLNELDSLSGLEYREERQVGESLSADHLECWDVLAMRKGLALIKQHLGREEQGAI